LGKHQEHKLAEHQEHKLGRVGRTQPTRRRLGRWANETHTIA
jgi:hypothetical protein